MAIIKYRVEARANRFTDSDVDTIASEWLYEEINHPEEGGRLMDRDEAMDLIRERKMIPVFKSPFGTVYDYPDEPFWHKYQGFYAKKQRRRNERG